MPPTRVSGIQRSDYPLGVELFSIKAIDSFSFSDADQKTYEIPLPRNRSLLFLSEMVVRGSEV